MSIENLSDLFLHTLKDVYFAEKKIVESLPKMIRKAGNDELRTAFEDHLEETKEQVNRLEKAFESIGEKAKGEKCPAIEGIIEEAEELIAELGDEETCDAALAAAAQAVEHYEIARYGTLCVWAEQLGHTDAKNLLEETLSEEKDADQKLTHIAETELNRQAMAA